MANADEPPASKSAHSEQAFLADVASFSRAGPLYAKVPEPIPEELEWARHGGALVGRLTGDPALADCLPSSLERSVAVRVYHLYLPIYFWVKSTVASIRAARAAAEESEGAARAHAVVIGLSAPQGCGKTTLVDFLVDLLAADGLSSVVASIDDFYLTGADQDALAASQPDNALLQGRGLAGSHDMALGQATLTALRSADQADVAVPRYDKAARGGRGDRKAESDWKIVSTPCDVVLFEGWSSAFKARKDEDDVLAAIHSGLPFVNSRLVEYQAWDDLVDAWCVIGLSDKQHVFRWRLQAEHAMAAAGRPGMDDEAVRAFVARYMPAYEAYCDALYASAGGAGVDGKPSLFFYANGDRVPLADGES